VSLIAYCSRKLDLKFGGNAYKNRIIILGIYGNYGKMSFLGWNYGKISFLRRNYGKISFFMRNYNNLDICGGNVGKSNFLRRNYGKLSFFERGIITTYVKVAEL
jgi:hypothetical protein